MRLKDKVAIITGSGSGIGKSAALMFAREGAKVVVADIDESSAKKTVEEIEAKGGEAISFQVDVTDESRVKRMTEAAKGAVIALTRNMALDLAAQKIRVSCIVPGTTLTPLIQELLKTDDTEAKKQARLAKYPIGRFGHPDEIAAAALFLASDEASFSTGSALHVDGGMTSM